MGKISKLKIFLSYSHKDSQMIEDFIKHIAPLKTNGLVENWYDRKILASKDFQDKIDSNLKDAHIICLFISASFLSSTACINEKKNAFALKMKNGIAVVPIILSPCGWLDDAELSRLLALPTDGKPVSDFQNTDAAWHNVYNELKRLIDNELKIKQLEITPNFRKFLQSTELLSKAHSHKETVVLEDIFIYPELSKFDELKEYDKKISSNLLIEDFNTYKRIIIAGENQSGKTTLCKKIFSELRNINLIPVYIYDKTFQYLGKIENRISEAFNQQYIDDNLKITDIEKEKLVIIIDDFHFAKNKEKHIAELSSYPYQVIIVDDIFNFNLKDENLLNSYIHFKINELNPILRNELIKNWVHLSDKPETLYAEENSIYRIIDERTELVNTTLGKIFGKGIMPSYPFFIISIISAYETFSKPLDEEITSQGYCYQAFIYMYLRKEGVKSDEIDTYINFLDEFSFFMFSMNKNEISNVEFSTFMEQYLEKFNLPIQPDILLEKLSKSNLVVLDSFNNYYFKHQYLYYFFVAKYLAEHIKENKEIIENIINNLHKDENAYIAIFICHHSKNEGILKEIISSATILFKNYSPASLSKEELDFFVKQEGAIVQAALPPQHETPETERKKRLIAQNNYEERNENQTEVNNDLAKDLRKSIKTVEVIGSIIKNRAGSLGKEDLKLMFKEAMLVHLRILTSFFDLIRDEDRQQEIVNLLSSKLKVVVEKKTERRRFEGKKHREHTKDDLEKISKTIFWNLNFFTIYGLITKIITSLGSNKLILISEAVCDNENTPASFLVKHGILMWYNKNLQVENIARKIEEKEFSNITKKVLQFLIVNHCSMHNINYRDRQKIENKFNIPSKKLLECKTN